jgi:hypothetical protein
VGLCNAASYNIQCVRKVAVHLQNVLEVMSTSVDTGLNPFNFIRLSAQRFSERTVSCKHYAPSTGLLDKGANNRALNKEIKWRILNLSVLGVTGARGGAVVEALRYKPEGRGIDSRWCHWNFSLT